METKKANIKELIQDSKNFNRHSEYGMSLLEKSVSKFGMGRSILLDKNNRIIAGNGITETAGQLGFEDVEIVESDGSKIIAVKRTDIDLDSPEGRELALADNATNKANLQWDFEAIEAVCPELEIDPGEWGVKEWDELEEEETRPDTGKIGSLADRFVVPPFSVLDSRKGKWKERKALWREKIGDRGETRENTFSGGGIEPQKPYCTASCNGGGYEKNVMKIMQSEGVSIFDPVLAEIICKWFGVEKGKVFDPFAGGIFGYVAGALGMQFTGIELRKEQADHNNSLVAGLPSKYICDDGQNVAKHIQAESQDLLFSCPPYYDLEVYSDLPNDASNQGSYEDFLAILRNAYTAAVRCLKADRFAVIVVGDIRDKGGFYRDFPGDIKRIFSEAGMRLYNEMILVEPLGSLPQRVVRYMENRKVGKCHQNVLVFYKGDVAKIKENYKSLAYTEEDMTEFLYEEEQ